MTIPFETVKSELEASGEVIITMDSGEKHELHTHDVNYHANNLISWDRGVEKMIIDGDSVEGILIHSSHSL